MRAIVAVNTLGYIGKDGKMLWHSPEDLKHFFKKTKNTTCLVGRKTYDSLPDKMKTSGGRTYLVVSRNQDKGISLSQALLCKPDWVIGGAEIYNETLHLCDEIHISRIDDYQEGDTKFPSLTFLKERVIEYNYGCV